MEGKSVDCVDKEVITVRMGDRKVELSESIYEEAKVVIKAWEALHKPDKKSSKKEGDK